MHEMSLCESVLRIIESEAPAQGFSRVTRVCLQIGRLACVEVEAMRFGFDVVTAGSLAAGARLDIERVPGRAWCRACDAEVEVTGRFDPCPRCGGCPLEITRGEELRIKELEVE